MISTKNGHRIQIKRLYSGWYTVGIDGRLLGCYQFAKKVIFEIEERLRQLDNWSVITTKMSARFIASVRAL